MRAIKKKNMTELLLDAIRYNDLNTVQSLIQLGVNLNQRKRKTLTPLALAIYLNNKTIITYLLEHGADVNKKNRFKMSPLQIAVEGCNIEMAKILIVHGADVNARMFLGYTPLYTAITKKYYDIIDLLINAGADVNMKVLGSTSLHKAVAMQDEQIIHQLLDAGAYINIKDYLGLTVLDHAKSDKQEDLRKLLINKGMKFKSFVKEIQHIDFNSVDFNEKKVKQLKIEAIKKKKNAITQSIALIILSEIFQLFSILSLYNDITLYKNGITTTGYIIEKRNDNKAYEIKYVFEYRDQTYSYSDITGRDNLWATLNLEDYDKLTIESPITVKFLENNPKQNKPITDNTNEQAALNEIVLNTSILFILGLALLCIGINGLIQTKHFTRFINKKA